MRGKLSNNWVIFSCDYIFNTFVVTDNNLFLQISGINAIQTEHET